MKKRIIAVIICIGLSAFLLCSCSKNTDSGSHLTSTQTSSGITISSADNNPGSLDITDTTDTGEPAVYEGHWIPLVEIGETDDSPTTYEYDIDNLLISESDGTETIFYEYYGNCNLAKSSAFYSDSFGNLEFVPSGVSYFDEAGNEVSAVSVISEDTDEELTIFYTYTYDFDDDGFPVRCYTAIKYEGAAETVVEHYVSDMTYDEYGNLIMCNYYPEGSTDYDYVITYMYSQYGDEFLMTQYCNYSVDEDVEYVITYTFDYDSKGNLTEKHSNIEYSKLDGTWFGSEKINFVYEPIVYPENPKPGDTVSRNVSISSEGDDYTWSYEEEYKYVINK